MRALTVHPLPIARRRGLAAAWLALFTVAFAIAVADSGAGSAAPAPAASPSVSTATRLSDVAPLPASRAAVKVPARHRRRPAVHARRVVVVPPRVVPARTPVATQ